MPTNFNKAQESAYLEARLRATACTDDKGPDREREIVPFYRVIAATSGAPPIAEVVSAYLELEKEITQAAAGKRVSWRTPITWATYLGDPYGLPLIRVPELDGYECRLCAYLQFEPAA